MNFPDTLMRDSKLNPTRPKNDDQKKKHIFNMKERSRGYVFFPILDVIGIRNKISHACTSRLIYNRLEKSTRKANRKESQIRNTRIETIYTRIYIKNWQRRLHQRTLTPRMNQNALIYTLQLILKNSIHSLFFALPLNTNGITHISHFIEYCAIIFSTSLTKLLLLTISSPRVSSEPDGPSDDQPLVFLLVNSFLQIHLQIHSF